MRTSTAVMCVTLLVASLSATGCATIHKGETAVKAGRSIEKSVKGNRATIDSFTTSMKSSESATFEATYKTSGKSPATVVYAVKPPNGVSFTDSPTGKKGGTGRVHIIANASGEYVCTPGPGAHSATRCEKATALGASAENSLYDFYTPSHWIGFLKGFSLAAGFAGDKVTSSTKRLNGFTMPCVDFHAAGVPGTSTICTASQGILGYVKVAGSPTSFELTKYSSSPPASLFKLPAGAKVTTITIPTTSPTP
jgi:hypothetical protein